jgi:hypothetical protein
MQLWYNQNETHSRVHLSTGFYNQSLFWQRQLFARQQVQECVYARIANFNKQHGHPSDNSIYKPKHRMIEIIVTMIARLLDLGNSTRNSSKTLSLTLPLISRKRCHPFVDGFSPLQKRSKILMKYGCHQNIEMHARTCDSQRNGVLCWLFRIKKLQKKYFL